MLVFIVRYPLRVISNRVREFMAVSANTSSHNTPNEKTMQLGDKNMKLLNMEKSILGSHKKH